MKILITGAAGFIGGHLVPSLSAEHELICLVRNGTKFPAVKNVTVLEADLAQSLPTSKLPAHCDAIIHLAQANKPFPDASNDLFAVNAASTQWLADYARTSGVRHFVYTSSGSVYAPSTKRLTEASRVDPPGFYALTKYSSERILGCYKDIFHACILRLFAPYGPGQYKRMIPSIVDSVRHERPVILVNGGQPRMNPIYIDDVIRILRQAITLKTSCTVNVAGPVVLGIRDIAEIAARLLKKKPVFEHRRQTAVNPIMGDIKTMQKVFSLKKLIPPAIGIGRMLQGSNA